MTDVVVVGGGIAGLTAALMLKREGLDVTVIEAEERAGGNLRTVRDGDYAYELGPHSFMPSSDAIWHLIEALNLDDLVDAASPASNSRFIYRDNNLMPLPMSPKQFIKTRLISGTGKFRLAAEPFIGGAAKESDTAKTFFERRLGPEATRWMIGPFISGIYAGDPEKLGARDAFFKMWTWEREAGSMILGARRYMKQKKVERGERAAKKGLFSFKGGLGTLTDRLAQELGEAVHTGASVTRLQRTQYGWQVDSEASMYQAERLIVAVPPIEASAMFATVSPAIARYLSIVEMAPVSVLHAAVGPEDAAKIPDGFGFLVPREMGIRTLGCIFVSKLFGDRAPNGDSLLSFYLGGVFDPDILALSNEETAELAMDELEKIIGQRVKPHFVRVLRHPRAIPQLTRGHLDRMLALKFNVREVGNLYLAGNYLSGVGMNDAAQSGLDAAASLLRDITL